MIDALADRIERRMQLVRGQWVRWRGARTGMRFGIGPGVRIRHPRCLSAGDDVTIAGLAFLDCLSERGVQIGSGCGFAPNLWLHCGGMLGRNGNGYVFVGSNTYVGCNAVLGASGGIEIGSHVRIGQCVCIHAENHVFADPNRLICQQGVVGAGIVIEDDVWIGSHATILDGTVIGRGSVVGAGAVVTESVAPYTVVAGVPARPIGLRGTGAF